MPACPTRTWRINDMNSSPKNTEQSKEMDDKFKKMMADRNALDAKISNNSNDSNGSKKNVLAKI